jgi:hypothetical protein
MAEVYDYDGGTLLTSVRSKTISLQSMAEAGAIGTGRFVIDDTAGTIAIIGQKDFVHTEDDCPQDVTFRGFIEVRGWGRDAGERRAPHTGASRGISVNVSDLNAMLGFIRIHQIAAIGDAASGKRPPESVAARGAWLLASPFWPSIADNGRVDFSSTVQMDEADYRTSSYAGDVLADMKMATGTHNYHVQDYGAGPELIFRDDNASTVDTTDVRISNVLTDIDSDHRTEGVTLTFGPSKDAELSRDPGNVISEIGFSYAIKTVSEERPATAAAFNGIRGGTASNSHVKTEAQARQQAREQLFQLSTEEDVISCSIEVPSSVVNLVMAGYRIRAKFSHLGNTGGRDYDEWTWFRIIDRTASPLNKKAAIYKLDLRLSPQEEGQPAAAFVQKVFDRSGGGAGKIITFPNLVTLNTLLVVGLLDRGAGNPPSPNTAAGQPRFGPGAWTKVPNTTVQTISTGQSGAAFWVKKADSTSNTCLIPASDCLIGAWEISVPDADATIAAIVDVSETEQTNSLTMSIGSLGTAAVGTVAVLICGWEDQVTVWPLGQSLPSVAAGDFTVRSFGSSASGGWITQNSPFSLVADALGTGAALAATVTKSHQNAVGGTWGNWCGIALLIEPQ